MTLTTTSGRGGPEGDGGYRYQFGADSKRSRDVDYRLDQNVRRPEDDGHAHQQQRVGFGARRRLLFGVGFVLDEFLDEHADVAVLLRDGEVDVDGQCGQREDALVPRERRVPHRKNQEDGRGDQQRQVDLDELTDDADVAADHRGDAENEKHIRDVRPDDAPHDDFGGALIYGQHRRHQFGERRTPGDDGHPDDERRDAEREADSFGRGGERVGCHQQNREAHDEQRRGDDDIDHLFESVDSEVG
jgi:hypothetical protein